MKKKWFVPVIVTVIVAAIVVGALAIVFNAFKPEYKGRTAIIYSLEGEGVVVARESEYEQAYAGMRLKGGDTIMTNAETQVTIRIDNDKDILLGKSSSMVVTTLEDMSLVLTLTEGEFFFNVAEKLGMGETMVFKIGATSMSIRGTSGGGSIQGEDAQFVIITGAGAITKGDSEEVEVYVIPQTKVEFNSTTGYDTETATVSSWTASEDQSETMTSFLQNNEEYRDMLNEQGWVINEEGTIEEEPIVEVDPETKPETYVGWRQNGDGSWEFSQEDFDAGVGPTYYVYPEKPVAEGENTFTYDGTEKQVSLTGFDPEKMTIEFGSSMEVGHFTAEIKPLYHWADETTDTVYVEWSVIPAENDLGTIVYDGQEHTMLPAGFNPETMSISGNVAKNAGFYTINVTSKTGVWQDGTEEPFIYTWEIVPAELTLSQSEFTRVYDGSTGFQTTLRLADNVLMDVVAQNFTSKDAAVYNNVNVKISLRNTNGNYVLASDSKSVKVTIQPKVLLLNDFATTITKTYFHGTSFTQPYSEEPISDIVTGDDVEITANVAVSSMNAGTYDSATVSYTLSGAQAGNYTVSDSSRQTTSVTISPASLTIDVQNMTVTYGDTLGTYSATVSGYLDDDDIAEMNLEYSCNTTGQYGTYTITATYTDNDNYTVTVNEGTLTINKKQLDIYAPTGLYYTYGDSLGDLSSGIIFDGLVSGDTVIAITSSPLGLTGYGTYTIEVIVDEDDYPNYNIATHSGTLQVAKRPVTITANNKTKTYGATDPTLDYSISGALLANPINVFIQRQTGENVGSYSITPSVNATLYPNYDIQIVPGTFTISQKTVTIRPVVTSKTYGDSDPTLTATVEGIVGSDTLTYTLVRAEGEVVNSEGYDIYVQVNATQNDNYIINTAVGKFNITPKAVTVTVNNCTKTYGDADPTFTATETGVKAGDTLDYSLTRVVGESYGEYVISATLNTTNPNYTVSFTTGKLTISKRTITYMPVISGGVSDPLQWEDSITNELAGASITVTRFLNDTTNGTCLTSDLTGLIDGHQYEMFYRITCSDDNIIIVKHKRTFTFTARGDYGCAQSQSAPVDNS